MKAADPNLAETLAKLQEARHECSLLIEELEKYNWHYESYPLGIGLPYPEGDIDHFHARAGEAKDLKTRLLAIFDGLGTLGKQWSERIQATDFYEPYLSWDPLARKAKRPRRSGLKAAREIIQAAHAALVDKTAAKPPNDTATPLKNANRPRGPKPDLESYRKVAEIVRQHGENWRDNDLVLDQICEALDKAEVPKPDAWRKWNPRPPRSWAKAMERKKRPVVQAIEYRISKAEP